MPGGFGAFGKMPVLGDFFRVNLPQGFIDPWDQWLQQRMLAVQGALGARWRDCYMSAPIWRFALSPGLAGPQAMLGVMMASVDRVGRLFPLTLAAPLPDSRSAILDHVVSGPAFRALEGIALDALDDGMTRERLADLLAGVVPRSGTVSSRIRAEQGALVAVGGGGQGLLPELVANLASPQFRSPSVWSADVEGGLRLIACEGLPKRGEMLGLFDLDAPVWQESVPA